MAQWLKQSTAATIKFGPFVDSTDGATAKTALTIAQANILLAKNGGTLTQSHNAAGATHDANGYYAIPLDSTDTDTLGRLRVTVSVATALPVWQDFVVVAPNIFDSLIGGGDILDVNVSKVNETSQTARDLGAQLDGKVSDVTAKTNYLPSATAGAAGGVFIAGSNAATTGISVDVQTGLTNQGYTTARAGYQDTLNNLVVNIWAAATRTLTANPGLTIADIRTAVGMAHADLDSQLALLASASSVASLPTAAGIAAAVWAEVARTLTANPGLTEADIRTAIGLALANLDSLLAAITNKVNALPANPAATTDIPTVTAINTELTTQHGAGAWGAGSVPTANDIATAVDAKLSISHGAGVWGGAGGGTTEFTYTVTDTVTHLPLEGVTVIVTTDAGANNRVAGGDTDSFGNVTFWLDAGTYYLWLAKPGYSFPNPDVEVVT